MKLNFPKGFLKKSARMFCKDYECKLILNSDYRLNLVAEALQETYINCNVSKSFVDINRCKAIAAIIGGIAVFLQLK